MSALVPILLSLVAAVPATAADAALAPALFHDDPAHPWNQIHATFWLRVDAKGIAFGQDRLDPLLWPYSRHLVEGESNARSTAALDDFLSARSDTLIRDLFARAVLQRDLWAIFDAVVGRADPLAGRLATLIGHLALSREQIDGLPDPCLGAPQLPPDLFVHDGPWVCLGRPDDPVAPTHTGAFPRSTFLAFLSLPSGRASTLEYLSQLRRHRVPAFDLPPLPAGSRVALVRRDLLVDDEGRIAPTRLTTQVQLRDYLQVPDMTPERASRGLFQVQEGIEQEQRFVERVLDRRAAGLRPVGRDFAGVVRSHGIDPFEESQGSLAGHQRPVLDTCQACHGLPGIYSLNALFFFRLRLGGDRLRPQEGDRLAELGDSSPEAEGAKALRHLAARPEWQALAELLDAD